MFYGRLFLGGWLLHACYFSGKILVWGIDFDMMWTFTQAFTIYMQLILFLVNHNFIPQAGRSTVHTPCSTTQKILLCSQTKPPLPSVPGTLAMLKGRICFPLVSCSCCKAKDLAKGTDGNLLTRSSKSVYKIDIKFLASVPLFRGRPFLLTGLASFRSRVSVGGQALAS